MKYQKTNSNRHLLLRYAGLTMQILVGLGLAVFAGYYADRFLKFAYPLFVWILPLIVIITMIVRVIKDTSSKNK
ncbi:MAG: AtpZ/AtpI family protein [Chitinophagaceae bacterium]|nr:AtpZ/AtpI family protein [Chitinophagaceae bacterium]